MSSIIFKPPNVGFVKNALPTVFLAGSIDNGKAGTWAATMQERLSDLDINILNPRRDDWNPDAVQSISDPYFKTQVDWELSGMEYSDVIAMYFEPGSISPITLLEFGLWARSGKLIVACPEGFWRRGNLEVTCHMYDVPLLDGLDDLAVSVRNALLANQ